MQKYPLSPAAAAGLQRAAARRGRALLAADDIGAEMAAMTPLEAFWAVKEVGLADAEMLVGSLQAAQLQACLDLDCWRDDALDVGALDAWLAACAQAHMAREDAPADEALAAAFFALDEEVAAIFLAQSVGTCDRGEDDQGPQADTGGEAAVPTADATMWVWPRAEAGRSLVPILLVEALYRADPQRARRLLLAARWELPAQLEEEALRFRQARLEDLGFPGAEAAAALWARPRPAVALAPARPPEAPAGEVGPGLPAVLAGGLDAGGELACALGEVRGADAWRRHCDAFVALVNALWVGLRQPAGDADAAADTARLAACTVSLGLAARAGEAAPQALLAALEHWGMRALFQAGRMELLPLARRARGLRDHPELSAHLAGEPPSDDDAWATAHAQVAALCHLLPQWAGFDAQRPRRRRPISCRADIQALAAALGALAAGGAPAAAG